MVAIEIASGQLEVLSTIVNRWVLLCDAGRWLPNPHELGCGYLYELWRGEMYPAGRWVAGRGKSQKQMAGEVHIGVTAMVETWMFVREVRDHVQYSNCLFPTAVYNTHTHMWGHTRQAIVCMCRCADYSPPKNSKASVSNQKHERFS